MPKNQKRQKKDHILILEIFPELTESDPMTSDDAHELFSWLSTYFPGMRTTIAQLVPVQYAKRILWVQEVGGGPTIQLAERLREDDEIG